ncbi:C39 family peptidase [Guggenheimella bovis]
MISLVNFPRVDNLYFGGNQSWFEEPRRKAGGCGVVAATNIVLYYMGNFTPSKEQFVHVMNGLYRVLSPLHAFNPFIHENTYGLPCFTLVIHRLSKYLKALGQTKRFRVLKRGNLASFKAFIKESIDEKHPVLLLLLFHKKLKAYSNHYMTITGYEEGDTFLLELSTWGQRITLNLEDILDGAGIIRMGRFY